MMFSFIVPLLFEFLFAGVFFDAFESIRVELVALPSGTTAHAVTALFGTDVNHNNLHD